MTNATFELSRAARATRAQVASRPLATRVAVLASFALCAVLAFASEAAAQVRNYSWEETTGVRKPDEPKPAEAAPEPASAAAQSPRRPRAGEAAGGQTLSEDELRRMIEVERRRLESEKPAAKPADQEFFEEASRIIAESDRADSAAKEAGPNAPAAGGPTASPHLIDAGHRLWRISEAVTDQVTYVAVSISILLFLVALLLWYLGIFTTGQFANPVLLFNRAAISFVLLLATPMIMSAVDALGVGAAKTIDYSFSSGAGPVSSTKEVFRKLAAGMANHSEDYTHQTLIEDGTSSVIFGLGWISATFFYMILRAIWEFVWIALKIAAPLAAMCYMVSEEFGGGIFKAWLKSVLCIGTWPVGWAIIFGMINAGIDDFSRTAPGTLYQVAWLCYLLAFLIMAVPALITAFWSGAAVDGILTGFGAGVANAAASGGIGGVGGMLRNALPGPLAPAADMFGAAAGHTLGSGMEVMSSAGRGGHIPNLGKASNAYSPGELGAMGAAAVGAYAAPKIFAHAGGAGDAVAKSLGLSPAAPGSPHPPPTAATGGAAGAGGATAPPAASPGGAASAGAPPSGQAAAGGASSPATQPGGATGGSPEGFFNDFLKSAGVAPAGELGRNANDPRGVGVSDASGNRVHAGDTARYAPKAGVLADGHYYQGTVSGFSREDAAHRHPIMAAREYDASGNAVSGVQQIHATDWNRTSGNYGHLVSAAGAATAGEPEKPPTQTVGPGVVVGTQAGGPP